MKYTDADITKALKCCANKKRCSECPFCLTSREPCYVTLAREASSLLTRRELEVETWKKVCAAYRQTVSVNERIHLDVMWELTEEARAEAIKEFAERLKRKSYITKPYAFLAPENTKFEMVDVCDIDNLVKELTEETP